MATSSSAEYDCQVDACQKFFADLRTNGQKQKSESFKKPVKLVGEVFDITGRDAYHVLAQLSNIVNRKKEKTYFLLIKSEVDAQYAEELFEIKARPAPDEPGNGTVRIRPRGEVRFAQGEKSYVEMNGELEKAYGKSVSLFAVHMKQLFANNARIAALPQITAEVYVALLFEIARRLVHSDPPTDKQRELEEFPVGTAITRIIKLLERDKTLRFKDVFLPEGKFHCFTGEPDRRRTAINNINGHYAAAELKEMFCPVLQGILELDELPKARKTSKSGLDKRKMSKP